MSKQQEKRKSLNSALPVVLQKLTIKDLSKVVSRYIGYKVDVHTLQKWWYSQNKVRGRSPGSNYKKTILILLEAECYTTKEIAKRAGCSTRTVERIKHEWSKGRSDKLL